MQAEPAGLSILRMSAIICKLLVCSLLAELQIQLLSVLLVYKLN